MSLKLWLAARWMPKSVLTRELDRVASLTTRALDSLLIAHAPDELASIRDSDAPLAGSIESRRKAMAMAHNARVAALIKALGRNKAVSVGRETMFATGRELGEGGRLTCVDISSVWIGIARKALRNYDNVAFVLGDIRHVKLDDESFDAINVHFVIHDIEPKDRADIVSSLLRKLKRNGKLFILEPLKPHHGMPVEEIRSLMRLKGLKEERAVLKRTRYEGTFVKS